MSLCFNWTQIIFTFFLSLFFLKSMCDVMFIALKCFFFCVEDLIVSSRRIFTHFRSVLSLLLDVYSFVSFRSTLGNPCSKDNWANIPSVRLHEWNLQEYMHMVNVHFSTELKCLVVIFVYYYLYFYWLMLSSLDKVLALSLLSCSRLKKKKCI